MMDTKEAMAQLADIMARADKLRRISKYSEVAVAQLAALEEALRHSDAVVDHFEVEHGFDCMSDDLCDAAKLPRGSATIEGLVRAMRTGPHIPPGDIADPGKAKELLAWLTTTFEPPTEGDVPTE